ncbi:MAG: ABC transporter substrate-binding protein [Gammaproteobacteria bacterium]
MTIRISSFRYLNLLLLLILTISPYSRADETTGAIIVVEKLHETLLNVMKNAGEQGFRDRYNVLAPVVNESFDTPLIAKVATSRYWKKLSDKKKSDFIRQFNKLSISTYASRFDSFSGESFNTLSTETLKKGRLLIKTEISSPGDDPVRLDYLMHNKDGKWYIISVIADGVNDLALKRAEYASVIKKNGFDALISKINDKIRNLEKPADN